MNETSHKNSYHENKYISEHPITIIINHKMFAPEIINESAVLDSQQIQGILLNTLNYLHIKSLSIKKNPLMFLPDIYTLATLDCSNCMLKELPTYMPVLTTLNCSNNLIKSIPNYSQLSRLDCSNNIISKLPELPSLKSLIINNNPITQIYTPTLTYLEAYNCPILILFDIPGLVRRSSIMDKTGSFKWILTRTEKINHKNILIDWVNNTIDPKILQMLKSRFWQKVFKQLKGVYI